VSQTYLQFDLSSLTAPAGYKLQINSAKLSTPGAASFWEGGPNPFSLYLYPVSDDSWTNASISWSTKPAIGTVIGSGLTPDSWAAGDLINSSAVFAAFVQQQLDGDLKASVMLEPTGLVQIMPDPDGRMSTPHAEYYPNLTLILDYSMVNDPVDLNSDGVIDMKDLKAFIEDWMRCVEPDNAMCEMPWL
jgi:hypothetical protein